MPPPAGDNPPGTPPTPTAIAALKAEPTARATLRAVVHHWRRLTTPATARRAGPGARTLVALSGGADSTALALALATATPDLVLAHVVHDLRPEAEAHRDRDAARALAAPLGLPFAERAVHVRPAPGARPVNLEAAARRARYAALADMARAAGCRYVATAHHADDQLETVIMSLLRGAGPAGLRGMPAKRLLARQSGDRPAVWLIRPMLAPGSEITRDVCRRLCRVAGVAWAEDATNADTTRLRAAVRASVVPALKAIAPRAARRALAAAEHAVACERLVRRDAGVLIAGGTNLPGQVTCARSALREAPPIVLGEALRLARRFVLGDAADVPGAARLGKRTLDAAARAIRDASSDPRSFPLAGAIVEITARHVTVRPARPPAGARTDPVS